ncbi:hypothetical protein CLFE_011340 [Clostridium felsineum DSM 794]|nr:hypothetical protein CLFE_011340 [Clostridium felsineum DSM 794]
MIFVEKLEINKSEVEKICLENNFKYAWINTYSNLYLSNVKEIDNFYFLDDLIEAKFFNEIKEASIIKNDDEKFSVVIFDSEGNNDFVEEQQILQKHKSPFKNENDKLVIRHFFKYDDDGQAYVYYTKLCDIKCDIKKEGEK